jgi:hypothetical protein
MVDWKRVTVLLGLISVVACAALAGPAAFAFADETGGETTAPTEPPPVETPTEPEAPPAESTAPPVETPVTTSPGGTTTTESVTPTPEAPKGTTTTESSESSLGGGGGGGGGGSSGGSGSSGTTTTSAGTATTHHAPSHVRAQPTHSSGGGSKAATGTSGGSGGAATGGRHATPGAGGSAPSNPTVSPQQIDEGATAVSHAAAHVGEVFAEALPTAPVKRIGTRVAAHIGLIPKHGGAAQREAVDKLGTALGAALIGSAVAVEKTPAPSHLPIPFFEPPAPKSATLYLVLIAVLLLAVGALLFREVRSALGFSGPRTGVRVADERPRLGSRERAGMAMSRAREAGERSLVAFRRLSANAVSGVRSLF